MSEKQSKNLFEAFMFWRMAAVFMLAVSIITTVCGGISVNNMRRAAEQSAAKYQAKLESVEHVRDLAVERLGGMAQKVEALEAELDALQSAQIEVQSTDILADGPYVCLGEFKLTAYCPCSECCGRWADGLTATGIPAGPGIVAVDPEVIELGSTVIIDGQKYLAADTGVSGFAVDICMQDHAATVEAGVRSAEVWVVEP